MNRNSPLWHASLSAPRSAAAFQIEQMMNRMYAAQEARWAAEDEAVQQEYRIALRRQPGPIQLADVARYMGRMTYDAERVSCGVAGKAAE